MEFQTQKKRAQFASLSQYAKFSIENRGKLFRYNNNVIDKAAAFHYLKAGMDVTVVDKPGWKGSLPVDLDKYTAFLREVSFS